MFITGTGFVAETDFGRADVSWGTEASFEGALQAAACALQLWVRQTLRKEGALLVIQAEV